MQARILLLGLPVAIQKATVNGESINRVRVGPFKGIDDMNRSRAKLGEEKITTSVVRP
jgi:cell division protein FtsN